MSRLATVFLTATIGLALAASSASAARPFAVPRDAKRYGTGPLRRGSKPKMTARWKEIDRVLATGTRAERRALVERARKEYGVMYSGARVLRHTSVDAVADAILRTPGVWASKYHIQLETAPDQPGSEPGSRETHIIQRHVNAPVLPALPDLYHVRVVDLGTDAQGRRQIAHLEQNDRRASRNHFVLATIEARPDGSVTVTAEATGIVRTYDHAATRKMTSTWARLVEGGPRALATGRSPAIEHLLANISRAAAQ